MCIRDSAEALKKCAKIVAEGFFIYEPDAKTEEERLNNLCTMAFPVFENGCISGALGARIPLFRFSGMRRETILRQCRETADRISREISLQNIFQLWSMCFLFFADYGGYYATPEKSGIVVKDYRHGRQQKNKTDFSSAYQPDLYAAGGGLPCCRCRRESRILTVRFQY
eukprot:TRINITY_DN7234_c0_g2_i1.p2 TRINITY_DN7234_c0_g2~~TRINITY_DN7234_c0_g2_i1.p2  ORF type:complete len:169 (-),score=23.57 TRINITY_DN7234_c0_g2_i1:260-766(-)